MYITDYISYDIFQGQLTLRKRANSVNQQIIYERRYHGAKWL